MATVEIPLRSDLVHTEFQVQLDGTTYTIEVRWNARAGAWFLTIRDADDEPIVSGIRLVVDLPLLMRSADGRRPPGQLVAVDTGGTGKDPGLTDLGSRVVLLYYEAADLPVDPAA